ncbi:MAG: FecR family protein, partial [Alphaproteobacteria bacterium]|nr:FecR family protein [Alphaproteobacteria bacterium]
MAHSPKDNILKNDELSENNAEKFDALAQDTIEVSGNEFIADATMTREGQDLRLESPEGESVVIENYFMAEPAPVIQSPDGSILTENLVESFLQSSAQYAQSASLSDESPVGAVEEVNGEATVIRVDGTSEPITLGTPIYQGDIIETSADGAVNVSFIDETSMAVSENARMAIDEYQFDPSTESGTTNLSVLRGVFVFTSGLIGRDDPDDVLIDTPVGSIGIRGTIIAGKINPGGESEITVVEGAIVVKNGAAERTLSQQFETVKLGGFNDNIQDLGVKAANDVGKTYGSVSDVVPKLFSSINDAAK